MARKRKYDIFVVGSCNDKSNIDPIVVKLRTDGCRCWTGVRRSGNNTTLPYRAIEASSVILFFSSVLATTGSMVSSGRAVPAAAVGGLRIGGVAVAAHGAGVASTIVSCAAAPIAAFAGCCCGLKKLWNWIDDSDVEDNVDRKSVSNGDANNALVIDRGKPSKRGDGKVLGPVFAPFAIWPYSIESKAGLPASMRNDYHFEEV